MCSLKGQWPRHFLHTDGTCVETNIDHNLYVTFCQVIMNYYEDDD